MSDETREVLPRSLETNGPPDVLERRMPLSELPRALGARERLWARGAHVLGTAELLGLLLGPRGGGARPAALAGRLLRRHGVRGLGRMSAEDWRAEPGLGPAIAARLAAALELGRRATGRDDDDDARPRLSAPRLAWAEVRELGRARKEHLVGLYLDAQNALLCKETLSIGALNVTRTHPREVLFPAVTHLALGFILVHNHPSGCLDPSPEDVEFTQSIRRAGELMGIELYDHLIVTRRGYTSLRERGLL